IVTGINTVFNFAKTKQKKENLYKENKDKNSIFITANTVIDALKTTVETERVIKKQDKRTVLVTVHRTENLGNNMKHIFKAIRRLVDTHADIEVVYPVHLNPKVQEL